MWCGLLDEFLDVDLGVAERLLRLDARGVETLHEAAVVVREAHAASAAAGGGLDHDGIADLARDLQRLFLGSATVRRCRA